MPVYKPGANYVAGGGRQGTARRYATLQKTATMHGVKEPSPGMPSYMGAFNNIIDWISRPIYANLGVIDVMLGNDKQGNSPMSRFMAELDNTEFAEKEFGAEVLEQAGVPEGGRLSDLIGKTWVSEKMQFDPTARGAAGLAMDILFDPLTYLPIGPMGKVKVMSRGGKVTITAAAEKGLTAMRYKQVGVAANRLGRRRVRDVAVEAGEEFADARAKKAAGQTLEAEWWKAVESGDGQAIQRKFIEIEQEMYERNMLQSVGKADTATNVKWLEDSIGKGAENRMERVLNTLGEPHPNLRRATQEDIDMVLQWSGAKNVEDLIAKNAIKLEIPFIMTAPLVDIGKSGNLGRLVHTISDPGARKLLHLIERNDSTRMLYQQMRASGSNLKTSIENIFRRDKLNPAQWGTYVTMKQTLYDTLGGNKARLESLMDDIFLDDRDPEYLKRIAWWMDSPSPENAALAGEAAKKAGIHPDRVQKLYDRLTDLMAETGHADVANRVLDANRYGKFAGKYTPHMWANAHHMTAKDRDRVSAMYLRQYGKEMSPKFGIGRFAEHRYFDTFAEFEQFTADINTKLGIKLKVDYDLIKTTAMRVDASWEAAALKNFFDDVSRKFSRKVKAEQSMVLAAVTPQLKKTLKEAMDAKKVTSEHILQINELLGRATTFANDFTVPADTLLGITDLELARDAGLISDGMHTLLGWLKGNTADDHTRIEIVNTVRRLTDGEAHRIKLNADKGREFIILGATDANIEAEKRIVETVMKFYENADITTVAKEWYRRGWNLLTPVEKKQFGAYYKSISSLVVDPETGKRFRSAADLYAQEGAERLLSGVTRKGVPVPLDVVQELKKSWSSVREAAEQARILLRANSTDVDLDGIEYILDDVFRTSDDLPWEKMSQNDLRNIQGERYQLSQKFTYADQMLPGAWRHGDDFRNELVDEGLLVEGKNGVYKGDSHKIARWLSENSGSPVYRDIARSVAKKLEPVNVPLGIIPADHPTMGENVPGNRLRVALAYFWMKGDAIGHHNPTIAIRDTSWNMFGVPHGMDEHTMLHEMVHAATSLQAVQGFPSLDKTTQDSFISLHNKWRELFYGSPALHDFALPKYTPDDILKKVPRTPDFAVEATAKVREEFLAWGMTNNSVQQMMGYFGKNGGRKLHRKQMDLFSDILDVSSDMLEEFMDTSMKILDDSLQPHQIESMNRRTEELFMLAVRKKKLSPKMQAVLAQKIKLGWVGDPPTSGQRLAARKGVEYVVDSKGRIVGGPQEVGIRNLAPIELSIGNAFEDGVAGRYWYETSSAEVLSLFNGDIEKADKFIQLLAVYSPQATVGTNYQLAVRAWNEFMQTGRITTRTGKMDEKAVNVMTGKGWKTATTAKTDAFYHNLRAQFPDVQVASKDRTTVDVWMMRAYGFSQEGPSSRQYEFVEQQVRSLTARLNKEGLDSGGWTASQVQAAIWVGAKQETEAYRAWRGSRLSALKRDPKVKVPRENATEWFEDVYMATRPREQRAARAWVEDNYKKYADMSAKDFSDYIEENFAYVPWEVEPGAEILASLPSYRASTMQEKFQYMRAVHTMLTDDFGNDALAELVGLHGPASFEGMGFWDEHSTGNITTKIMASTDKALQEKNLGRKLTPVEKMVGHKQREDMKEALDLYTMLRSYVLEQDGVGWFRPVYRTGIPKGRANGIHFKTGRRPNTNEMKAMGTALGELNRGLLERARGAKTPLQKISRTKTLKENRASSNGWFVTPMDDGFSLVHGGEAFDVSDFKDVHPLLLDLAKKSTDDDISDALLFFKDGGFNVGGATNDGKDLASEIGKRGGRDLLGAADDYRSRLRVLRGEYSERLGWGNAPVPEAQRTGKFVELHHVSPSAIKRVDPKRYGTNRRGKDAERILLNRYAPDKGVVPGQMPEAYYRIGEPSTEVGLGRNVHTTRIDEGLVYVVPRGMEYPNATFRPADWYRRGYRAWRLEDSKLVAGLEQFPVTQNGLIDAHNGWRRPPKANVPDAAPEGLSRTLDTNEAARTSVVLDNGQEAFQLREVQARKNRANYNRQKEADRQTALDPRRSRAGELEASAREIREAGKVARYERSQQRVKRIGQVEAGVEQDEIIARRRAQREADIVTKARGKLKQKELRHLQAILDDETRAITAANPELQMDLFGQVAEATPDLSKAQRRALQALRTRVTKARNRITSEINSDAADLAEAMARQTEYNAEVSRLKYGKKRFMERKRVHEKTVRDLNVQSKDALDRSAALQAEANELLEQAKGHKVQTADIIEQDRKILRELPQEGQAAFLYQSLIHIKNPEHLANFLNKYEDILMKIDPDVLAKARTEMTEHLTNMSVSPYGGLGKAQHWQKVSLPGLRKGGESEWILPADIARDLADWDKKILATEEIHGLLRLFDWATNTFKGAVTIPFPSFHFRNAYSNIFQSALDIGLQAFNPERHLQAIAIMARREGTLITKSGRRYTYEHVRSLMRDHQIKVDFNALAEIIEGKSTYAKASGNRLLKKLRKVHPGQVSGHIETEARAMHFITLLMRDMAPADAALQMKRYLFDYSNLSQFEKNFLRRIIPFYTWQSKNIRLQIRELFLQPGKINNLQKPFRDRGPDGDMLPEYLRGDLRLKLTPGPGKEAAFLTGIDLPIQNIDMIFAGSLEKTMRENLGMLNPLLKAPLEMAFNKDAFTGRPIFGKIADRRVGLLVEKFPKPMRDYFELEKYLDKQGNERFLLNGTKWYLTMKWWALSRVMSTTAAQMQHYTDEESLDWWKLMTGLQIREFDLTEAQKNKLRAQYERLEVEMIKRGLYKKYEIAGPRPGLATPVRKRNDKRNQ